MNSEYYESEENSKGENFDVCDSVFDKSNDVENHNVGELVGSGNEDIADLYGEEVDLIEKDIEQESSNLDIIDEETEKDVADLFIGNVDSVDEIGNLGSSDVMDNIEESDKDLADLYAEEVEITDEISDKLQSEVTSEISNDEKDIADSYVDSIGFTDENFEKENLGSDDIPDEETEKDIADLFIGNVNSVDETGDLESSDVMDNIEESDKDLEQESSNAFKLDEDEVEKDIAELFAEELEIQEIDGIGDTEERAFFLEEFDDFLKEIVPEERWEAIKESMQDAPEVVKERTGELMVNLAVNPIDDSISKYDPDTNIIFMDERIDNDRYANEFRHELGHFIDDQLEWPSHNNQKFSAAIEDDIKKFKIDDNKRRVNNMLEDIFSNNDVASCGAISDILSAFFINDKNIIDRYYDESVENVIHENEYWAINGHVEKEIFANVYSIIMENNSNRMGFIKKYFPNTTREFNVIMKRKE